MYLGEKGWARHTQHRLGLTFPDGWKKGSHSGAGPKLSPRGSQYSGWTAGLNIYLGWSRGQLLTFLCPSTPWALSNVLSLMNKIATAFPSFPSASLLSGACFGSILQPVQPKVEKALAPFEVQRFIPAWPQELLAEKRQVPWGWARRGPRATFWLSSHQNPIHHQCCCL